jgi:hypothetical protein
MPTRSARRTASCRGARGDERQVERHDDGGFDENEVHPEQREKRHVEEVSQGVENDDDLEPQRRPVQQTGLVRVLPGRAGLEDTHPAVDVGRVRVPDDCDEHDSRQPRRPEHDGEVACRRIPHFVERRA